MMMLTYEFRLIRKTDPNRTERAYGWAASERIARDQVTKQYGQQWDIGAATIVPGVRAGVDCSGCK